MVYTLIKPSINTNIMMEKFLYPNLPVRCIITNPSECGKSVIPSNLYLIIINEYDEIYIYSSSLHQDLYQRNKCFSNFIPIHIIPKIVNDEDFDIVVEEIVKNKDIEKSDTEIGTYESIDELKLRQDCENNSIVILDGLNQKEMDDPRVEATFERSRHINLSIFIINQDYYELRKNNTLQL